MHAAFTLLACCLDRTTRRQRSMTCRRRWSARVNIGTRTRTGESVHAALMKPALVLRSRVQSVVRFPGRQNSTGNIHSMSLHKQHSACVASVVLTDRHHCSRIMPVSSCCRQIFLFTNSCALLLMIIGIVLQEKVRLAEVGGFTSGFSLYRHEHKTCGGGCKSVQNWLYPGRLVHSLLLPSLF